MRANLDLCTEISASPHLLLSLILALWLNHPFSSSLWLGEVGSDSGR
jgi:hypothetical protein